MHPWSRSSAVTAVSLVLIAACQRGGPGTAPGTSSLDSPPRLPTGRMLDAAGTAADLGSLPLAMTLSPDGRKVLVLLNGSREQGVQVVDRATGRVDQTLVQAAAFLGIAFSPDGRTLYASGGNQDVVYRYAWRDDRATLTDSLVLAVKRGANGTRYPGGLAPSPDGRLLYVAENLADSVAVFDLSSGLVIAHVPTERWPYGVVVAKDGTAYVSAWGGNTVSMIVPTADNRDFEYGLRIRVGRHPSALLLNHDDSRLFIASASTDRITVVDTKQRRVLTEIHDSPPGGPGEGSTPSSLALSNDGTRLFVTESDNNAVALIDLAPVTSGVPTAAGDDRIAGRVPTRWYPTAVVARGDTLLVLTGKGRGSAPNRNGPRPGRERADPNFDARQYTLGQTSGTLETSMFARVAGSELSALSARVARANFWGEVTPAAKLPPFEHVVYIVKENRTYDQLLGDLPKADGDTSLVFFPRPVSPNHHALAVRFGVFDRFLVNAEVSPDGHNWSMAAYTTDYTQKTVPSNYSRPPRGRTYDWEGENRGAAPLDDDDVAEPANGYLWTLAQRAGISFRNYGEFVIPDGGGHGQVPRGYLGNKPFLRSHTNFDFPGFDLGIRDQERASIWLADLAKFTAKAEMPKLQVIRLPNDHTSGGRAGAPSPRAQVADNDLALGRVVEGLSMSPFWKSTLVVVVEDDAQNGSDHVDSHRSILLLISAWNRPGVYHRFVNTTDVVATIERVLGLGTLSQFDHFGRPVTDIFADSPDLRPYAALTPSVNLGETNPTTGRDARESAALDLRFEDLADEALFNRILWRMLKGDAAPYPRARRMSSLEYARSR